MTKENFLELLKKIGELPAGTEIVLLDHRMNCHYADGDGTPEGIYAKFDLHSIPLSKMDSEEEYTAYALSFVNDVDYDESCEKIIET